MELPILYFKGDRSQVEIFKLQHTFVIRFVFISANSAEPP